MSEKDEKDSNTLSMRSFPKRLGRRSVFACLGLFSKGILIGIADTIPGFSGGSMAFITGIYRELVESLGSFRLGLIRLLWRGEVRRVVGEINLIFLGVLFLGIGVGVFLFAGVMVELIESYGPPMKALFLGLMISSVILILRGMDLRGKIATMLWIGIIGLVLGYVLTSFESLTLGEGWIFTFLAGVIGICAMILPGISGSFLLLVMGKYREVMEAIEGLDFGFLMIFGFGCCLGLILFSRLLKGIFRRWHREAFVFMSGLIVGCLHRLWPWWSRGDEVGGVASEKVLPWRLIEAGESVFLTGTGVCFMIGVGVPWLVDGFIRRRSDLF